jgi:hypothetical protein
VDVFHLQPPIGWRAVTVRAVSENDWPSGSSSTSSQKDAAPGGIGAFVGVAVFERGKASDQNPSRLCGVPTKRRASQKCLAALA